MGRLGRVWSVAAGAQRQLNRRRGRPPVLDRKAWIRQSVPGRSFADVGGLYGLAGEMAFVAEDAGASEVTLFDAGDPDLVEEGATHPSFDELRRTRDSKVRYVQGDLEDPEAVARLGPHDVVLCTGVLYHSPAPARQLMYLRDVTRDLLLVGTVTMPEIPGFPQACVFFPYLDNGERRPYERGRFRLDSPVGPPLDAQPMHGHANCWYGITPSALRAMLRMARFEVVGEYVDETPLARTLMVARPLPIDPSLPPLSYFRQRGDARERGERWSFDTWFEEQRERER